ncbi:LRR domain containing protein [Trema orientale]|uniref:LRR domain containing protein n=1 Tax=Trema orientale TaxID=63057 RepID=A0A2P5C025_TREOI|nr:LRR domain containing protein [Trema orientale]
MYSSLQFLPASLAKLTLQYSHIRQDPMAVLEQLPNLKLLRFVDSYSGSKLACSAGGFSKLETLQFHFLYSLDEWQIEKDATPSLNRVDIVKIPQLKLIPEGSKLVTTLRRRNVIRLSNSLERRLIIDEKGIGGEDFYKVRHIASISISQETVNLIW